jgi:hypothetical protein
LEIARWTRGLLLLVHSPKAEDRRIEQMFRGHGAWFGAVDQGLALINNQQGNHRKLEMSGRLSRGKQTEQLVWTPGEGWSFAGAGSPSGATGSNSTAPVFGLKWSILWREVREKCESRSCDGKCE